MFIQYYQIVNDRKYILLNNIIFSFKTNTLNDEINLYKNNVSESKLNKIKELDILNDNGIVVCEYEFEKLDEIYGCLELIKDRKYGKTSLKIYKNRR